MALGDLDDIVSYRAATDNLVAANRVLERIRRFAETLVLFPHRGRIVPELKAYGISTYREIILVPWRLMYRVEPGQVCVMSLVDSRRDLEELLFQRFLREESELP